MRVLLVLVAMMLINGCSERQKPLDMKGLWIPEKVDWSDGSFNTFYFYNDTSFALLASTQKMIKDSIYFQAEPGYGLSQGYLMNRNEDKAIMVYNVLYKFMILPGEKVPSDDVKESIKLTCDENKVLNFQYKGIKFVRTNKYTLHSENVIKSFPVKMIPQLKKEYGIKENKY